MAGWWALFVSLICCYRFNSLLGARVGQVLQPVVRASQLQGYTKGLDDGCFPTQVHIALGKDATQMHVSWKTTAANCPSELIYQPVCTNTLGDCTTSRRPLRAGRDGATDALGYSFLLSERDMCSEPAASKEFMLYLHRVKFTQLEPNARYMYQVAGSTTVHEFTSGAAPSPDHTFTFLAFGDMGDSKHKEAKSPGAASTLLRLEEEVNSSSHPSDLILHVGDISYANGLPGVWDSFMDSIEPVASRVPYMVAVGNHEYGYSPGSGAAIDPSGSPGPYQPSWGNYGPDSLGECGVMTARRFHMPQQQRLPDERDNAPFWYGFDYGSVHFTVISTEHDLSKGSRQHRWLEQELAAVDRCTTPWLVLLLHRPMYVVYPHKSNREVADHIRGSIEHLLQAYRVDLTVAGHVHSYYRTCAVYDSACAQEEASADAGAAAAGAAAADADENDRTFRSTLDRHSTSSDHGTVHFIIGSAGHKLSDVEKGQEDWVSRAIREFGYGRFTVLGSNKLLAEFVSSETGEVLDSVTVRATAAREALCATDARQKTVASS